MDRTCHGKGLKINFTNDKYQGGGVGKEICLSETTSLSFKGQINYFLYSTMKVDTIFGS